MWPGSDGVSVSVVVRLDSPSRFSLETYMAIAVLADHILCWSLSSSSVGSGRPCSHLKKLSRSTIVERIMTSSRPVRTIASITVVGSLITPAERIQVLNRACQVYVHLLISTTHAARGVHLIDSPSINLRYMMKTASRTVAPASACITSLRRQNGVALVSS